MSIEISTGDPRIDEMAIIAGSAATIVLLAERTSEQAAYTVGKHAAEAGATLLLEAMARLYGDEILSKLDVVEVEMEVRRILDERRISDLATFGKIVRGDFDGVGGANGNVY